MCGSKNTNPLVLTITNKEVNHKGKQRLIHKHINPRTYRTISRPDNNKTHYSFTVTGDTLTVTPAFKSEEAYKRIRNVILKILNNSCEQLDDHGKTCSDFYDCCDCGDNDCGCIYCFSCNACDFCKNNQDD
jgi:hypothetical protein